MAARWSLACPDWEAKLRRGETPIASLPLNEERARRAVEMYDDLRLPDVPGKPRLGEVGGQWFRDVVQATLASENPDTGLPCINEALLLVPKKNSKTTNSAALGLTAMMLWDRPNAQMMIVGPTQSVADRCFWQAKRMIEADAGLKAMFDVQEHKKTITRLRTGSVLQVKSFDSDVVTGEIPALAIVDELHLVAKRSYAQKVIGQITGGTITNPWALVVYITTQSEEPPQGVFRAKLQRARGIRDGVAAEGENLLPVLYEYPASFQVDEAEPWRDPAHWHLVNSNMHRSVQMPLLLAEYRARQQEGEEAERLFATQHLNIEVGVGLHGDRWAGAPYWAGCATDRFTLEELIERSEVCVVGVDWGGADDLCALAVIGRSPDRRTWYVWARAWARPSVLERRKEIAGLLREFEEEGDLRIVESGDDMAREAAALCVKVRDSGKVPEQAAIGLDQAGIALFQHELEARGMEQPFYGAVSQGWKLQSAHQTLALKLEDGQVRHAGQRLMAWAVGNAKQELKVNTYQVTKKAAGASKIDPLMAVFDAAELMLRNPEVVKKPDLSAFLSSPIVVRRRA